MINEKALQAIAGLFCSKDFRVWALLPGAPSTVTWKLRRGV